MWSKPQQNTTAALIKIQIKGNYYYIKIVV